jgi:transcriptional regulator with XRE-family HTH domain
VVVLPLQDLLRALREAQGESLRAAARALDVDAAHLSRVERGEKPASAAMLDRASSHYSVAPELLALSRGQLPADVVSMFQRRPELIEELRGRYAAD